MKRWALRVSVFLCALAVLAGGAWRQWWSAEHFREAVAEGIKTGDFSRAERLAPDGAPDIMSVSGQDGLDRV